MSELISDVRRDPRVLKAYLGDGEMRARPRAKVWDGSRDAILSCLKLSAGYGAAPTSYGARPASRKGATGSSGSGPNWKSTTRSRRTTRPASR